MENKILYRILEDENEFWRGKAYNSEHAEERCFSDEEPGSLVRYTLQKWGRVKISSTMHDDGWVTVYKNACLKQA
jgi:hypothetical protein